VASTDIHQHLWPPAFFSALSARSEPPRLRGRALELAGAPVWDLNVEAHELDERLTLLDRLELECAVVSLQPTLGIDRLPANEAGELFDAWEEGVLELARAAEGRMKRASTLFLPRAPLLRRRPSSRSWSPVPSTASTASPWGVGWCGTPSPGIRRLRCRRTGV